MAVIFFTANANAQVKDSTTREKKIDEVVLIGYGSVKKKNLTSAVENIKADAFENRPLYNVGQALQGNAAGISVVQTSGKPGATIDVKIRGNNSISSGVSPLYVVDGIQTFDISGVNPDDIVDMTILKDATSTAIYGINGSAGVVIVTTKRGKANKTQLNFNAYWGVSKVVNNIDVLNLDQYKKLMNEINPSYLDIINNPRYAGINTNWRDEVFRSGLDQNYNVNYSFGGKKVRGYAAMGYQGIDGVIDPAKFERVSTKLNLDAELASWLKLSANLNFFNTNLSNTNDNLSTARGGVVLSALNTPAFLPIWANDLKVREKDTSGVYLDGYKDGQFALNPFQASWENPVAYQSRKDHTNTRRLLSGLNLEVKLAKNLVWKPSLTYDITDKSNQQFTDAYRTTYGRSKNGVGSHDNYLFQDMNIENTLSYTFKQDAHDLNLLVGNQIHQKDFKAHGFSGSDFPTGTQDFVIGLANNEAYEYLNKERLREVSYFGRMIYTYASKYTVMGVFRENGNSALAPGKKWGFFPGVSAAWTVSNEDFLKDNNTISDLKIRGGWGKTGNASGIPAYSNFYLERLNHLGGTWSQIQSDNRDLQWETTTDTNGGVDVGFLNNRIKLSADVYKRVTDNLVMNIPLGNLPYPYTINAGKMENKGVEFTLNTVNYKGDFNWNTSFNISFTKNKILELNYTPNVDRAYIETVGSYLVRFSPGQPISSFFGYKVDKVDPATGELLYKDLNGNGYTDTGDRTFLGNPTPDYTIGFTNNFSYKNWYLDVLVTASQGNEIYNASRFDLELMSDFKNQSTAVLDRWTNAGQITNVPKANASSALVVSDRFVEDGSFVKLKNVTLGYNFLNPFKGVSKVNLYVTGQNLYTWTNYTGFDPEVNAFSTTNGVSGIDYGTYPQVRTIIFGLKANF